MTDISESGRAHYELDKQAMRTQLDQVMKAKHARYAQRWKDTVRTHYESKRRVQRQLESRTNDANKKLKLKVEAAKKERDDALARINGEIQCTLE